MQHTTREDIFNIPLDTLFTKEMVSLANEANHNLGVVSNISSDIFDDSYIIDVLKNIEALTSAQIEGTTATLKDLYLDEALSFERKKQLKLFSAVNYKFALDQVGAMVESRSNISESLIKEFHHLIADDDPSTSGPVGSYRKKNVKIRNKKLGDFYPPEFVHIPSYMSVFISPQSGVEEVPLFDIAIRHVQFEAIHPFEDGNGRTGRLLILAQLLQHGLLSQPVLFLSHYFEKERDKYLHFLRTVTDEQSYEDWLRFFFEAVITQSQIIKELIDLLQQVREEARSRVVQSTTSTTVPLFALEYVLEHLYVTISDIEQFLKDSSVKTKAPYQTAYNAVQRLVELGILKKDHKRGKTNVFVMPALKKAIFSIQPTK